MRSSSRGSGALPSYLLDECLHEDVAAGLQLFRRSHGDTIKHVYDFDAGGTDDWDIPALCRSHGIECVISANVRDFGARKTLYIELLNNGIHVVVLRFGTAKPTIDMQGQILLRHLQRIGVLLGAAAAPVLIKATATECVVRSIEDLIAEITGEERGNLP